MLKRRHVITMALLGVTLAIWTVALQSQPSPRTADRTDGAAPHASPASRVSTPPYSVFEPASPSLAAVDLGRLQEHNHLSELQVERAVWRGGGIVSCDLSNVLPDGQELKMTVASPERASMDFELDISTWNHGNHWPLVHMVAAAPTGQVDLFVQHPNDATRNEVLTLAWADANDEHPVPCAVVDRQATRLVTVHLDAAGTWWQHPELVAVVGCGQTRIVNPDTLDPVQIHVAEACAVHTWRTVAIASSRSAPIMLSNTGPSSVTLAVPHVPVQPDLGMSEVAIDAGVFIGLDAADDLLSSAAEHLEERWPDDHIAAAMRSLQDTLSP